MQVCKFTVTNLLRRDKLAQVRLLYTLAPAIIDILPTKRPK
ncbi:hypothetical protein B6N60_04346 [Richelia sinica FACHB-800]|uniref:Uncharacterized protein n=1 Tax=Richelia sinica FACHB-800 TaxID=1357546 RepID=A0A975TB99_9NOST|nr:hypothetical protein B6N60_04346 [Richelia sinica FACHB-800]